MKITVFAFLHHLLPHKNYCIYEKINTVFTETRENLASKNLLYDSYCAMSLKKGQHPILELIFRLLKSFKYL